MLYAKLVERESTVTHIQALQSDITKYGAPLSYYTDCHSIFRYIKGRDHRHKVYEKITDDIDPQWKQVIKECGIKPIYALSPQAKGKIKRTYGWLQDHLVRTCIRDNVKDIAHAQRILNYECDQYNYRRIHSTTREIPSKRFESSDVHFSKVSNRPPHTLLTDSLNLSLRASISMARPPQLRLSNRLNFKFNSTTVSDKKVDKKCPFTRFNPYKKAYLTIIPLRIIAEISLIYFNRL
jgi:hypothetical protein